VGGKDGGVKEEKPDTMQGTSEDSDNLAGLSKYKDEGVVSKDALISMKDVGNVRGLRYTPVIHTWSIARGLCTITVDD
jgi:hypothetical protein